MNKKNFINELDDKEIDMMLKYITEYSPENAKNIKNKFEEKSKIKQKKFLYKKLVLVTIVLSIMLITTLAYAEILDISKIYTIIFGEDSKYLEQHIKPLDNTKDMISVDKNYNKDKSKKIAENETFPSIQSEYDGIVIKLISAVNDENVLRIFSTITDTKGDRLGESLDFSWGLSQGYGGNINVIDYDDETKTAALMITSLGSDHYDRATLMINSFSTGRELIKNLSENNININKIIKEHIPKIISQDEIWKQGGGGNNHKIYKESRLLKFDEMDIEFDNTNIFSISNIGFVDGLLHIQTKARLNDTALNDNCYINIKFVNSEKEIIYEPTARIDFIADKKYAYESHSKEPHNKYMEMIYEPITNPEQLNDLSIAIDYMKLPEIIEGNWKLSFETPEKVTTEFHIDKEININGNKLKINMISLSPFGITVHLPQNISSEYNYSDSVYVKYKNGTDVELNESSIHTYGSESTIIFGGPIIKIENIKSIIINGEKINILQ